jgi:hypothetical protein
MAYESSGVMSAYSGNVVESVGWEIIHQDVRMDTSTIRVYGKIAVSAGATYSGNYSARILIDGTEVASGSKNVYLSWADNYNGEDYAFDATVVVNHTKNGYRTITCTYYSGLGVYTLLGKQSYELPPLYRATTIFSFPDFTIGDIIPVQLDRRDFSFTNTLILKSGNTTIKTITGVNDFFFIITLTPSEQDTLYATMANTAVASVTLRCVTNDGMSQIGIEDKSAKATVPADIVPSFTSITGTELTDLVTANVGALYIKSLSNIRLAINGATGIKSSTIASYKISYNGVNYNTSTVDTGIINWSGSRDVVATITDSRGRTASKTLTLNVSDYAMPLISSVSISRCNIDKTENEIGSYVKIPIIFNVASIISDTERNSSTLVIKSKLRAATEWTTIASTNYGVTLNTELGTYGTYDATQSYDFIIQLSDIFNTVTATFTMTTAPVVMSFSQTGVGIGKVWERGSLDISGESYIDGNTIWHAGNDGSGSGLDADKLGGIDHTQYSQKSIVTNATLTNTSWSGSAAPYSYTFTVNGVTDTNIVEILPLPPLNDEQVKSFMSAQILTGSQTTNTVTLDAYGQKPTTDLPITIIIRGDI